MDFVHLHVQSAYSLLSSTIRIDELVAETKSRGMKSIALTDRNVMYGVIPFYKACKKNGIKPIIGLLADVLHGEEAYPLLLLARNNKGYSNLMKISSSIQTKSKKGIPLRWLKGYHEGLIAITPGNEGIIESHLAEGKIEEAKTMLQGFKDIFGESYFYLSIQKLQPSNQEDFVQRVIDFSVETETKVVATNPMYYLSSGDALACEVLNALQDGTRIAEVNGTNDGGKENYFKGSEQMNDLFTNEVGEITNSIHIASQCEVEIEFHQSLLPKYPTEIPSEELLQEICEEGFNERYPDAPAEYTERLRYELSVIKKMNFSDYFLIVWDFMKFARQQKILTGPGRGSAAGSIVAYVLKITDIDPMEHNLLFERFLNPERVSMPDIDIDFSDIRRDEVISYVAQKYGELHVAQIITFGTFATKAALRDTGRMFGLNSKELDSLSKMIPSRLGITIQDAMNESPKLKKYYEENEFNALLINTAKKLEGLPRHTSTHAAGVVICDIPLTEKIAIQGGRDGVHLTQFPMETLEELGLLKMDFLGLRNLTLMERILNSIKKTQNRNFDIKQIPMDDKKTLSMLSKGETIGIFQFESEGMQKVLLQLKPERFADLVAVNALYRPGPMENIPTYIRRRHGEEEITYLHPDLENILNNTYGIIVYQEQIIQIASKFAGFSLGEADLLRRAVSKKKANVLQEQRKHFIMGCLKQGYENHIAERIYDYIVKFANYGFNLSHAAAYSFIAYQLAYLKAHYPKFFMASLMSSVIGNDTKISQYVRELKKMNITLLPPSINSSGYAFQSENGGIRYSLASIKGIGGTAVKEIVNARREKKFNDLFDFCGRVHTKTVNRKMLESLIHSGAFDEWGEDRASLLASLDVALDHAELVSADKESYDLFQNTEFNLKPKYITMEPIPQDIKLQYEKEVLGLYLSDHPVSAYHDLFQYFAATSLFSVKEAKETKYATGVYITESKVIRTKAGESMAFLSITDDSDELEAVVFPSLYKSHAHSCNKGNIVMLQGYVEKRNDRLQFVVQAIYSLEDLKKIRSEASQTLYIKIPVEMHTNEKIFNMKKLLKKYPGTCRVKLYLERDTRTVLLSMWNWINPTADLLSELNKLLGEKNVIFKSN